MPLNVVHSRTPSSRRQGLHLGGRESKVRRTVEAITSSKEPIFDAVSAGKNGSARPKPRQYRKPQARNIESIFICLGQKVPRTGSFRRLRHAGSDVTIVRVLLHLVYGSPICRADPPPAISGQKQRALYGTPRTPRLGLR